jgi:hypothetical protein
MKFLNKMKKHVQLINWKPPPLRVFKVNWDAAVESNRGKIGLGMIARLYGKFRGSPWGSN